MARKGLAEKATTVYKPDEDKRANGGYPAETLVGGKSKSKLESCRSEDEEVGGEPGQTEQRQSGSRQAERPLRPYRNCTEEELQFISRMRWHQSILSRKVTSSNLGLDKICLL